MTRTEGPGIYRSRQVDDAGTTVEVWKDGQIILRPPYVPIYSHGMALSEHEWDLVASFVRECRRQMERDARGGR